MKVAWLVAVTPTVVPLDRHPGAPQGTIDGEIQYPDGRRAGLEITGVEPQELRHLNARLARERKTAAPGAWSWSIHVNTISDLSRLQAIHERVILLLEKHDAVRAEDLPADLVDHDPDLEWIAWETGSSITRLTRATGPTVYWPPPISTAIFSDEATEIEEALADAVDVDPIASHLEKLLRADYGERHLFLIVGTEGLSAAAAYALIEPEVLPRRDPPIPQGVDHLWLAPGWGQTVTLWSKGSGWRTAAIGKE